MANPNNKNKTEKIKRIISHKDRLHDAIPYRLDFIKSILSGNELEPLFDLNSVDTESFTHPNGYKSLPDTASLPDTKSNIHKGFSLEGDNASHLSNCSADIRSIINKKTHDFYKVINDIGGTLSYIKSGSTGHTFMGSIMDNINDQQKVDFALKVVAYSKKAKYGDYTDVRRPENAELMMIRLLSYFVVNKKTPHIVLPVGTFYTSITPFVNLIEIDKVDKKNKRYNEFVDRYKKGEYHDSVSILISEWANRGDLIDFIKKYYKQFTTMHWKAIFFQLISVLAVIQSKFLAFRHNDLKGNNVLVHKITQNGKLGKYIVCKNIYIVPNIGYQIKLWDFDFACIPGVVDNAKVYAEWTDEINVKPVQNRYYDMHYFFNTLIRKEFFPQLLTDPGISSDIKDFINRIVPVHFREGSLVSDKGRILINDEYLIPDDVLKTDPFFEEFRNYKPKNNLNNSEMKKLFKETSSVETNKIFKKK